MVTKKDIMILKQLRKNARCSLSEMSRMTTIPISTLHDRMKSYSSIIYKHTSLLNFGSLGYFCRTQLLIKVSLAQKLMLKEFLLANTNVNTISKLENEYDFMVETVHECKADLQEFVANLQKHFDLVRLEKYPVVSDLKKEAFLEEQRINANDS